MRDPATEERRGCRRSSVPLVSFPCSSMYFGPGLAGACPCTLAFPGCNSTLSGASAIKLPLFVRPACSYPLISLNVLVPVILSVMVTRMYRFCAAIARRSRFLIFVCASKPRQLFPRIHIRTRLLPYKKLRRLTKRQTLPSVECTGRRSLVLSLPEVCFLGIHQVCY